MALVPKKQLTENDVQKGLRMVIWDGLAAEVMIAFTGSTFLTAMAILLGANNLQIGLLASMPTITNLSQVISIFLVRKFNNRRAIAVYCAYLARIPLVIAGFLILWLKGTSVEILLTFLFLYYFFGSIAGPSWNSWMKDMVPEKMLGIYFSRRTRYTQMLNVVMSLVLALLLDYVRDFYAESELYVYAVFFILAGTVGILGGYLLSRAPEPQSKLSHVNIVSVFRIPLQNINFRRLLFFNSAWVFATNLGIPFFAAYMLKGLGLPISYIIILNVISQIMSILTIRVWGIFSDKYSNKTIIALSAPIYIAAILAWSFAGIFGKPVVNLIWLAGIHFFMGIASAGMNLSLTNIGLKLAPNKDAIVYLSVKNIITSVFSSVAPLIGGILADYFANIQLTVSVQWNSPNINKIFKILALHEWNFLFLISSVLAILSLEFLIHINEVGEMDKLLVRRIMRTTVRKSLREYFLIGNIISIHDEIRAMIRPRKHRRPAKKPA